MSLPFISAICLQYGDVPQLEDSLACFLAQDYEGESEIIVLNSFPRQRLSFEHPKVQIVNLDTRPPSLADCRNAAIEHARGDIMVTWDSDDAFAPWYLSTIAKYFPSGGGWAWMNRQFSIVGWKIMGVVAGSTNSLSFTKKAWRQVGCYPVGVSVGEDKRFVSKLTVQTPGAHIDVPLEEIGYLYSWGESNFHISGLGEDRNGRTAAYERARIDIERRVNRKLIPTGDVILKPVIKHDYGAMAKAFLTRRNTQMQKGDLGVMLAGRNGDIINALPILKRFADRGRTVSLICLRQFSQVLDGVSYVKPHAVDLSDRNHARMLRLAKNAFNEVLDLQSWKSRQPHQHNCASYCQELWNDAGLLFEFHNKALRPIFDRRDASREAALITKLFLTDKPKLVTNLTTGTSSPFSDGQNVLQAIRAQFESTHEVVEVGTLTLHRIYDLLAIIEMASLFVSIDTATLHLAAATNVPVVALVNDTAWLSSIVRFNEVATLPYRKAAPTRVVDIVRSALFPKAFLRVQPVRRTSAIADAEDKIIAYYRTVTPRRLPQTPHATVATVKAIGLGDTMMLTDLARNGVRVTSTSKHFASLMAMNPYYQPTDKLPDVDLPDAIANYDCGNGHYLQRARRIFRLRVQDKPAGFLNCIPTVNPNLVAMHFGPGIHSRWQEIHVHPRARMIYEETRLAIEEFVKSRPDLTFVQVGERPKRLRGVTNVQTDLVGLIQLLSTAGWFVGIMSGPVHVATALGVRCIVIVNFPSAHKIFLPTLISTGQIEEEWFYGQHVHLHQEADGPLVKRATCDNLKRAFAGEIYPFWTDDLLPLIHETI